LVFGKRPAFMDGLTGKVLAKKIRPGSEGNFAKPAVTEGGDFFQPNPQGLTLPDKTAIQTFAARKAKRKLHRKCTIAAGGGEWSVARMLIRADWFAAY
jgi:hypothetical protein